MDSNFRSSETIIKTYTKLFLVKAKDFPIHWEALRSVRSISSDSPSLDSTHSKEQNLEWDQEITQNDLIQSKGIQILRSGMLSWIVKGYYKV
uniref:MADF domain-containing protein n=1 Tax=Syphacia muris TaxID=451379 RepID=A0A0N5AC56_9BILA